MFLYNREQLSQYLKQVFILLFQRLTSSKTTKYVKGELFVTGEVSFFRAGDLLPARTLFTQGIEERLQDKASKSEALDLCQRRRYQAMRLEGILF